MTEEETREKLTRELDETFWDDIRPSIVQGKTILVEKDVSLIDVGVSICNDDTQKVQSLLEDKKISIVDITSEEGVATVNKIEKAEVRIRCIIVSPYVLIQEFEGDLK